MASLLVLMAYLNQILAVESVKDYCPNGLQVEGKQKVKKLITGVTACQKLLDAAVAANADAILVHHGYFWQGESNCITGIKRRRLQTLLTHDISLLAYHLPLDLHHQYGNNVQLANQLQFVIDGPFGDKGDEQLIFKGRLPKPMTARALSTHITATLDRQPLHIAGHDRLISSIAWCTGGAQKMINYVVDGKFDAYLSGEISESTVHIARESGIDYFAAGHHATERYGVKALGEHLQEKFAIEHQFIDIDSPA